MGSVPGRLLEDIARLEAGAKALDPEPEQLAELWAAAGAHALDSARDLGTAPSYSPPSDDDPDLEIDEAPIGIDDALRALRLLEHGGINQTSGGHFAYIPGGGLFPAALGDLLADVGNRYSGVHFAAPAATEMERSLVRWMCGLVGYPETAGGDLTSGGSVANLEGIVTAREAVGIRPADVSRSVVYVTRHTHHCIEKALRITGLGEGVVRHVEVDERWRMDPAGLDAAVRADLAAGLRPWLVVATAGTTDTGAVDPLSAVADIADAYDLWLHVDAAYGGFFLLTEHGRQVLAGIDRSRTVVMNPHKGLFLPFGSGALLVRDERELAHAHRYSATYLGDARASGVFSPSDLSVELSRPFRGPRMWLPLRVFGLGPFRAALEEKLLLARYFQSRLSEAPGWEVGPEPDLSVVTYRYLPARGNADEFNRRLLEAVLADGRYAISATELRGTYTLRLAVLHYRSHLDHVDGLLEVLTHEAARLAAST